MEQLEESMASALPGKNGLTDSVCVIIGIRPDIIKMAPIILELQQQARPFFIIHTGQHYSYFMDKQFFEDLDLPQPEHHLDTARVVIYEENRSTKRSTCLDLIRTDLIETIFLSV